MEEDVKQLWVDKYRPTTLDGYVLYDDCRKYIASMIENRALENMTFMGVQGSGKTTLAKILCNEFNAEVLFIPCATDGTLDILRTKITDFCNSVSFEGKIKVVILDEVDSASNSGDNNFQKGLRTLIEAHEDDTRFILTANYNKIIPAVISRCPIIPLGFDKKDLLVRIKYILDNEHIKYDKASLKLFIDSTFMFCPDCRRIINYLQLFCNTGELIVTLNAFSNYKKNEFISEMLELLKTEQNILKIRQMYLQNKNKLGDFVVAGSDLFNAAIDGGYIHKAEGVLKLTELLYQLNVVVDKEPTFFGMLVAIQKYGA